MIIQKLDGPKGDPVLDGSCNIIGHYQGIVVGSQADLQNGDWARWSDDAGNVIAENRWFVAPPSSPQPNTPGNPYFGKKPKEVHDFYALCGAILPPARYKRLRNDAAFLWVQDMLQSPTFRIVDPDDKAGQFLQLTGIPGADGYLTQTLGEDSQPLMTRTERDAIMTAWRQ